MSDYGLLTPQSALGLISQMHNLQQAHVRKGRDDARWFVEQKKMKLDGQVLDEAQKAWTEGTADREQQRLVKGIIDKNAQKEALRGMDDDWQRAPGSQELVRSIQQSISDDTGSLSAQVTKTAHVGELGATAVSKGIEWTAESAKEWGLSKTDSQLVMKNFPDVLMATTGNHARSKQLQYTPQDAVGDAVARNDWTAPDGKKEYTDDSGQMGQISAKAFSQAEAKFNSLENSDLPLDRKKQMSLAVAIDEKIASTGLSDELKTIATSTLALSFEKYLTARRAKAATDYEGKYYENVAKLSASSTDQVIEMSKKPPAQIDQMVMANAGLVEAGVQIQTLMEPGNKADVLGGVELARPIGSRALLPILDPEWDGDAMYPDNFAKFGLAVFNSLRARVNYAGVKASAKMHGEMYNTMQKAFLAGDLEKDFPQFSDSLDGLYTIWVNDQKQLQASGYSQTKVLTEKAVGIKASTGTLAVFDNAKNVQGNIPIVNLPAGNGYGTGTGWVPTISADLSNRMADGAVQEYNTPNKRWAGTEIDAESGGTVPFPGHDMAYGVNRIGVSGRSWSQGPGSSKDPSNPWWQTVRCLDAEMKAAGEKDEGAKKRIKADLVKAEFMTSDFMNAIGKAGNLADLTVKTGRDKAVAASLLAATGLVSGLVLGRKTAGAQKERDRIDLKNIFTGAGVAVGSEEGFAQVNPVVTAIYTLNNSLEKDPTLDTQERKAIDMKLQMLWGDLNKIMGLSFREYKDKGAIVEGYVSVAGVPQPEEGQGQ